jgi:hypothetical protein
MQTKYQQGNQIIFYSEGKRHKAVITEIQGRLITLYSDEMPELLLNPEGELYEYNRNDLSEQEILQVGYNLFSYFKTPNIPEQYRMAVILDMMPEVWNRHAQRYEIAMQILNLWNNAN